MPELRKDPLSNTWVILSPDRSRRPQFYKPSGEYSLTVENCPFCPGNEYMTPPEITAIRTPGTLENQPGWFQRIIPNKYPALIRDETPGIQNEIAGEFYENYKGMGAHEVIIESTDHTRRMEELELEIISNVFCAYKTRIFELKKDSRFRYIQVFKNHGTRAGATISHTHSQVLALPVIPGHILDRLNHAQSYFKKNNKCLTCEMIKVETTESKRLLFKDNRFVVLAPYAPRYAFELAIYPLHHGPSFEEIEDEAINALASVFKQTMEQLNKMLKYPAYNLVLHTAPTGMEKQSAEFFHWNLEIVPITSGLGGFEIGTQAYINSVTPEESVKILKN